MAITVTCETFGILAESSNDAQREKCIIVVNEIVTGVDKPDSDSVTDLCKSLCADCGCPYVERVMDGDFTPLYGETKTDVDTIQFQVLKKDGTGEIISDQTLGTWIANETYIANWEEIRAKYGGGIFTLNLIKNIVGVDNTETSHDFQLTQYDPCIADGSVKFEWEQSGSVLDGRVFDPAQYYQSRLPGYMREETPEEEEETYKNNDREIKMIQKTIKRVYKYKSYPVTFAQKEMIVTNMLIANSFTITDLNVGTKEFKDKSLYLTGIDTLDDKVGSDYYIIELSFTDLKQTLIKRPC